MNEIIDKYRYEELLNGYDEQIERYIDLELECDRWINHCFELKEQNINLQNENDKVKENNINLQDENKRLKERMKEFQTQMREFLNL